MTSKLPYKANICPAPNVANAVPLNRQTLEELIQTDLSNPVLYFALGNFFFFENRIEDALSNYKKALELRYDTAELRCNLGVSYCSLGKDEDGISQFKHAILANPSLALAHLHLGRVHTRLGLLEQAKVSFQKLLTLEPLNIEALIALAEIAECAKDENSAVLYYQQAYQIDPESVVVQARLGRRCFLEGKLAYEQNQILEAFRLWGEGYKQFGVPMLSDQFVVQGFNELINSFNGAGGLERALVEFQGTRKSRALVADDYYQLFTRFYFSIGILPESFEKPESLEQEHARWKHSLEQNGEHPYPHFRLGLIYSYRGELESALAEMTLCQDNLLPKKQIALRIKENVDFLRKLLWLKNSGETISDLSGNDEWVLAGFSDLFQRNIWEKAGFLPLEAQAWKSTTLSPESVRTWQRYQLKPQQALNWIASGFTDAREVRTWIAGEVEPSTAEVWRRHFTFPAELAIQCLSVGLSDPAVAERWMKFVKLPWDAIKWHELGFEPEDAAFWLTAGVRDPQIAKARAEETLSITSPELTSTKETDDSDKTS